MIKPKNQRAWKREEEALMYRMGKSKALIADIFASVGSRTQDAIEMKLRRMGFNFKNGRIV